MSTPVFPLFSGKVSLAVFPPPKLHSHTKNIHTITPSTARRRHLGGPCYDRTSTLLPRKKNAHATSDRDRAALSSSDRCLPASGVPPCAPPLLSMLCTHPRAMSTQPQFIQNTSHPRTILCALSPRFIHPNPLIHPRLTHALFHRLPLSLTPSLSLFRPPSHCPIDFLVFLRAFLTYFLPLSRPRKQQKRPVPKDGRTTLACQPHEQRPFKRSAITGARARPRRRHQPSVIACDSAGAAPVMYLLQKYLVLDKQSIASKMFPENLPKSESTPTPTQQKNEKHTTI